jgi:hypothetical protein
VVGEEEDVARCLVEIVGAEALIDLGCEELLSFVEFHRDLNDGVEVDILGVERGSNPLTCVLFGDELSPPFGSREGSIPSWPLITSGSVYRRAYFRGRRHGEVVRRIIGSR